MNKDKRKQAIASRLLGMAGRPLGFIDVGSGGPLKHPWSRLPPDRVLKFDTDPEIAALDAPLICISDRSGKARFNIAKDPRASSLHEPSAAFMHRYGQVTLAVERTIDVELRTLADMYGGLTTPIDAIDVNVEGHDAQVLRGGRAIFERNFVKLVKAEYELTEVWVGQSWFSDVDQVMRGMGFDLAAMNTDIHFPPATAALRAPGEPVWGKALYVPSATAWAARADATTPGHFRDDCLIAICLYLLFDLPARALEVVGLVDERRSRHAELQRVPTQAELYGEMRSLYGTHWARSPRAELWRVLGPGARATMRPLVDRLLGR